MPDYTSERHRRQCARALAPTTTFAELSAAALPVASMFGLVSRSTMLLTPAMTSEFAGYPLDLALGVGEHRPIVVRLSDFVG
jgi:hypothetical protein